MIRRYEEDLISTNGSSATATFVIPAGARSVGYYIDFIGPDAAAVLRGSFQYDLRVGGQSYAYTSPIRAFEFRHGPPGDAQHVMVGRTAVPTGARKLYVEVQGDTGSDAYVGLILEFDTEPCAFLGVAGEAVSMSAGAAEVYVYYPLPTQAREIQYHTRLTGTTNALVFRGYIYGVDGVFASTELGTLWNGGGLGNTNNTRVVTRPGVGIIVRRQPAAAAANQFYYRLEFFG